MELLVVTGMSGAGKSTALDALEDLGFYCVDNVPVPLLPDLVALSAAHDSQRRVAVGIDAREPAYLRDFADVQQRLEEAGHSVEVLFLEAPTDVLVRRYSETRRKHPMGHLPQAIDEERELLRGLRTRTTATIDTTTRPTGPVCLTAAAAAQTRPAKRAIQMRRPRPVASIATSHREPAASSNIAE